MNLVYMSAVEHGDNLNSCGQKMNSSEMSSSKTTTMNFIVVTRKLWYTFMDEKCAANIFQKK